MKIRKKILSLALTVCMLSSAIPATTAFAADTAVCDTTSNFTMETSSFYQFKITSNHKPSFGIGNVNYIRLASSSKSGNDYFYKVQTVSQLTQKVEVGIYVDGKRICIITVNPNTRAQLDSYGIVETDDGRIYSEVGVLAPIREAYDPSKDFTGHRKALAYNIESCNFINNAITNEGDSSHAYVRFIQKNGKFGLKITGWRSKKSDNTQAATLNGALTAMVYLADSKKAGEAIWAWLDALQTTGKSNITNYGFTKTDKCGKNHLNVIHKDGTKVDITSNGSSNITILFN